MKDGFRYLDPERIISLELPLALKRIQKVKERIEDEVVDDDSQISYIFYVKHVDHLAISIVFVVQVGLVLP